MLQKLTLSLWVFALAATTATTATTATAQTIVAPVPVTGFTADVVANGTGPAAGSATHDMDGGGAPFQYCFIAPDYVSPTGDTPTSSLPTTGRINSVQAPFPAFQLAPYDTLNSLRLPDLSSGTLTLDSARAITDLWLLAASGNGLSEFSVLVTFADQTTQLFTNQLVDDWFGGPTYAIQGVSRVNYSTDLIQHSAADPRLYQLQLAIAPANRAKRVQNLTFTKTATPGTLNVMAVSANVLPPTGTAPEMAAEASVSIAPNPATTRLTVQHPVGAGGDVQLLDLVGRRVLQAPATATGATSLDVAALPSGVYLLRYTGEQLSRTLRVVKQ